VSDPLNTQRLLLHCMASNPSRVKSPGPALRDSVLNLILKKKCTGGCFRELENEWEANKCFGPCGLIFCPECAFHLGTHCQECRNFSCYKCWETISNNGCPMCDKFSDAEREKAVPQAAAAAARGKRSKPSSDDDDSASKQQDKEVGETAGRSTTARRTRKSRKKS